MRTHHDRFGFKKEIVMLHENATFDDIVLEEKRIVAAFLDFVQKGKTPQRSAIVCGEYQRYGFPGLLEIGLKHRLEDGWKHRVFDNLDDAAGFLEISRTELQAALRRMVACDDSLLWVYRFGLTA